MVVKAGAIIVPDMRVTKPEPDVKSVILHFFHVGQL